MARLVECFLGWEGNNRKEEIEYLREKGHWEGSESLEERTEGFGQVVCKWKEHLILLA